MAHRGGVLVTGATGFVGRSLITSLLHDGLVVYALSRDDKVDLDEKVNVIKGDVTERIEAPADVSTVIHCAGIWSDSESVNERERMHRVNTGGTQRVVEAALEGKWRLIHLGTAAVVGQGKENSIDETAEGHPRSFYEQTKYDAESIVRKGVERGLRAQILRPSFVFGVGRNPADDPFLQLVIAIKTGRYRNIRNGSGIYNIVHVSEVVHALRALDSDGIPNGGLYFVNSPITFSEFSRIVRSATTGQKGEPGNLPYPAVLLGAGILTLISIITGRRMPLTLSRLKTLTNKNVYSQQRLLDMTQYRPLCTVEERIAQVCREYSERGLLN